MALLAANHRSEQTKAQISSNAQQNLFANFYKHIEEFEKYIDTNTDKEKEKEKGVKSSYISFKKNILEKFRDSAVQKTTGGRWRA